MALTIACAHGAGLGSAWTTQVSARAHGIGFSTGRDAHVSALVRRRAVNFKGAPWRDWWNYGGGVRVGRPFGERWRSPVRGSAR